jgi:hypothetical protein
MIGRKVRTLAVGLLLACPPSVISAEPPPRKYSNTQRMALPRLKAVHDDVITLGKQRVAVPPLDGLNDFRCILHAHAEDSTHTGGTLPEMLAEAKKAGVHAILLTDHFRPPRDFIDGRWRGVKDGVLFIPGSESHGFLVYPSKSILGRMELKGREFIDNVTADEGLIFLSHLEERKDHPVDGLTGMEIENRHWDAKRDPASMLSLAIRLTDPKQLAKLQEALRLYPDELFAFQCDYPGLYLDKWDAGTKQKRLTGVAANDCHHNQILQLKMVDEDTVLLGTNVDEDKQMRKVTAEQRPGIKELTKGRKKGDIVASVDLDPYSRSFRNLSTHVLAPKLDEASIRAALKGGHAYVAHDWMGDATGFRFEGNHDGKRVAIMGDEVKRQDGLMLSAKLPTPATIRLIHGGKVVATADGKTEFTFPDVESGVYRLEVFHRLDGELRPWIFSNPIYVR